MTTTHRLVPRKHGKALVAIFEINGKDAVVSAATGIVDMLYKEKMTIEEARKYYRELQLQSWSPPKKGDSRCNANHEYVWNLYQ